MYRERVRHTRSRLFDKAVVFYRLGSCLRLTVNPCMALRSGDGRSFREQDPVAEILSLGESIRALRARAFEKIGGLSPADKQRYKKEAEANPIGQQYF